MNLITIMRQRKILVFVIAAVILAGAGWYYQTHRTPSPVGDDAVLREELMPFAHLFEFENKDPNLPDSAREKFFTRFTNDTNALRANPDNFYAWLDLGLVHKNLNAFEKARDAWEHLGDIRPLNSISFSNLGDLYAWFLHEPEKGEAAYRQALRNEPTDINFYRNLAEIYDKLLPEKKSQIDSLLEEGIKEAKTKTEKAELTALMASYERDRGEKEDALQHYRDVLKIDPEYPQKAVIQTEIKKL
ncbi:MAG: tetratricopeptide repeat protein [Patescibacteria group bacterium]